MSAALREYLMIVEESAFKVPVTTPVVWTQSTTYGLANAQAYYVRLDQGNAFTMRPRPAGTVTIPYGGGFAVAVNKVSDKQECKGRLSVILSVSQAPFLLSWAGVRITGGTAPWTTTEPNGDLASCSVYHAIVEFDGTVKRRVYLGTKVEGWQVSVSEDSTIARLTLDLAASTPQGNQFDSSVDPTSTTFPTPTDADFPIDPFVFLHSGGSNYVTLGGTVRTQFTELNIASRNVMYRRWFANRYVQMLRMVGRDTTVGTKLAYVAAGDTDRAHYEALASESCSIQLNNGTHGFTMNLNAQNVWMPFEDDLPLPDLYMQAATEANMWDSAAGSDFTLAFA